MAKQRSRVDLLKEGDINTGFFHAKATIRRRQNKIFALKHAGVLYDQKADDKVIVQPFYEDLFKTQGQVDVEVIICAVSMRVTSQMNDMLCRDFEDFEIEIALFSVGPSKATGVDGFTTGFY